MDRLETKKIRIGAALTAAVLTAGLLAGCANPEKAGVKALEEGNYTEAEAQFQEAAADEDREKSAEGYRGLGMTYYETGDCAAALDAFRKAVEGGAEQTVQLYHLMGSCAMQTGDPASALEYFKSGLALAGDGAEAGDEGTAEMIREMRYNIVICCENLADWETAKQQAADYLADYPDDAEMQREAEFLATR